MGASLSKSSRGRRVREPDKPGWASMDLGQSIANNSNSNYIYGSGTINNHNPVTNYIDARPLAPRVPLVSDVRASAILPAKPTIFHGRDQFIDTAVRLLVGRVTARLAILGSGGMGKTTIAQALLHNPQVAEHYRDGRFFLSCEALVDTDAVVVSLAKIIGLPASEDLLAAVVTRLAGFRRVVLVLDNLETVWLVGGAPVTALDELLNRLAQIPSLSLIITCRGTDLPQGVEWSNADSASLEPFSLEAAVETFKDRSGRNLTGAETDIAKQLLIAVDRMPLAVSLLGQLARRGNSVSELLARWNRERTSLLRTHGAGRVNNVQVSIELSIQMLREADDTGEALGLLSVCCMLPDGLRPDVLEQLRSQFQHVERARDNLTAHALAGQGVGNELKALSPIRHFILKHHPAEPKLCNAL